jgi:squalene-associated FAD-dependent desaturase
MKVAIIGAGIAGISSAVNLLSLNNIKVDIFEATDKLGGRVYSFKDGKTNEIIDNGKHLMVGAYHNFFSLLLQLHSYDKLQFQKYLKVSLIDNSTIYKFQNGVLGKLSQLISLMQFKGISSKEKYYFIKFLRNLNKISAFSLSVEELLKKWEQSAKIINVFWEPIVLATMNLPINIASASLFLEILKKSFFADKSSQRLVFSKIPLMQLFDDFKQIENANFKLNFETKIDRIYLNENQKYELSAKNGAIGIYDAIILAIPPKMAFKLIKSDENLFSKLNELQIDFFEKVTYSSIISIYLWTENNFLEEDFYGLINSEFHWIFKEKHSGHNRYTLTKSSADNLLNLSKENIMNLAYNDLQKNFKEFDRRKVIHYNIIFEKQATIKISSEIQEIRPTQKLIGGFYLAGDWTQTNLPATMESAALSGKLAVEQFQKDFSTK